MVYVTAPVLTELSMIQNNIKSYQTILLAGKELAGKNVCGKFLGGGGL